MRPGVRFSEYGDLVTDVAADLYHFAAYHRRRIADHLEQCDELRNALAAAESLHGFIRGTLYPIRDGLLNEKHVSLLGDYLKEFENALKLDLGALPIFVLEDKRGYSARQFVTGNGARMIFSSQDQTRLPPLCLEDIDHAGKCLMHSQFTAAGFHVIRALEAVTRSYYERVKAKPPTNEKRKFLPLGMMTNALKDVFNGLTNKQEGALSEIIPLLERINRIYRNPIMHPEMILKEELAIKVFETAKLVIDDMLEDMHATRSYLST